MANKLYRHETEVLRVLDEDGGFLTKDVAARLSLVGYESGHQRSGAVRAWLLDLRSRGFVVELDDQKPVCWKRTPAGTAALNGE